METEFASHMREDMEIFIKSESKSKIQGYKRGQIWPT